MYDRCNQLDMTVLKVQRIFLKCYYWDYSRYQNIRLAYLELRAVMLYNVTTLGFKRPEVELEVGAWISHRTRADVSSRVDFEFASCCVTPLERVCAGVGIK